MKKFLKFFPVALAAFALASCSSDDLSVANGEKELTNVDGKLLVQFEGEDGAAAMRGGYVTNIYNSNFYSAMAFDKGDALKLYHDATSWKPEVWTATEYGQYKNSTGISVFSGGAGATIETSENAYGIYPSTASVFGNENRTSIQYDFSELAYVDYAVDATKTYAGTTGDGAITKYYKAEFPLWGVKVADAEVMTMKHLAGILRLDVDQITLPTAADTKAYVIVHSTTKKLTGKIKTAVDLLLPTAAEELDPSTFMTQTPKLETEAAANAFTTPMTAVPVTEAAVKNYDNLIVMAIDNKVTDKHLMAYLPILPEMAGGDVDVYVTPVQAANATTVDVNAVGVKHYILSADIISECNDNYTAGGAKPYAGETTVKRGVTYKINDDANNKIDNAMTPFELAREIIKKDKAAYRDFDVYVTNEIKVKNEDTAPQNFYLDLSGSVENYGMDAELQNYELKHNVTVHVTLTDASTTPGTNISTLYVKTKGGKKLTLDITNGTNAVDSIVVKANDLKSELVLREATGTAQLPAIHVYKDNDKKLTLEAGTPALVVNSTVSVDNESGQAVSKVVLAKGVDKINLLNGAVTDISIADAGATDPYEAIDDDVTIYTEGTAAIGNVAYGNMPTDAGTAAGKIIDKYNLKFESKWIAGSTATTHATTTINSAGTYITSAAQLAGVAVATGDITVLGKYDLDGSTRNVWTALGSTPLTQSITGAQYFRASDAAARAIEGNATIENLYSVKGLIESWKPAAGKAISNFTFDGGNKVIGAANAGALGLLVGTVTTTNSGTIKNIKVKGTNQVTGSGTTATAMQAYGAVIGKSTDAAAALNIVNVQVASGTTVRGYQYVGGIVGEIAGKVIFGMQSADGTTDKLLSTAAVATGDVPNSSAATLETFKVGTAPYSSALPTKGSFFGGASASATAGDITIIGQLASLSTARTGAEWGYYVPNVAGTEYFPWTIHLNYNEIGHCGTTMAGSAVTVTPGFTAFHMLTPSTGTTPTYSVSTNLVPFVGTQAAYNTNVAAATYGIGKTMYFDFVKQP